MKLRDWNLHAWLNSLQKQGKQAEIAQNNKELHKTKQRNIQTCTNNSWFFLFLGEFQENWNRKGIKHQFNQISEKRSLFLCKISAKLRKIIKKITKKKEKKVLNDQLLKKPMK